MPPGLCPTPVFLGSVSSHCFRFTPWLPLPWSRPLVPLLLGKAWRDTTSRLQSPMLRAAQLWTSCSAPVLVWYCRVQHRLCVRHLEALGQEAPGSAVPNHPGQTHPRPTANSCLSHSGAGDWALPHPEQSLRFQPRCWALPHVPCASSPSSLPVQLRCWALTHVPSPPAAVLGPSPCPMSPALVLRPCCMSSRGAGPCPLSHALVLRPCGVCSSPHVMSSGQCHYW